MIKVKLQVRSGKGFWVDEGFNDLIEEIEDFPEWKSDQLWVCYNGEDHQIVLAFGVIPAFICLSPLKCCSCGERRYNRLRAKHTNSPICGSCRYLCYF